MKNPESPDRLQRPQTLKGTFTIKGTVRLETTETQKPDMKLKAYAFTPVGELLGSSDVDANGAFQISLSAKELGDAQLIIGPSVDDAKTILSSSAYKQGISPTDWKPSAEKKYILSPEIRIPASIWPGWLLTRVCVGGRVRKQHAVDGVAQLCPVPFVKVEVFDVDREFCWPWPWLLSVIEKRPDLRVIRLSEALAKVPVPPVPGPGPDPFSIAKSGIPSRADLFETVTVSPKPEPPSSFRVGGPAMAGTTNLATSVALNPQPEPPSPSGFGQIQQAAGFSNLQLASLPQTQAASLTSRVPFWQLFPRCFYSKRLVCTATTDCDGYFQCCFWWPAFHFRLGRFRWDPRPDIIIKVTQVINGVSTVVYMDPISNTRWNVTNTFIDLVLDDPDVVCGTGCQPVPEGTTVFFTRVGNDYVYDIEQTGGTWHGGGNSNVAYGAALYITAAIGKGLSEAPNPYYYRISISKGGAGFKTLSAALADTRVSKTTLQSESHTLGPNVINGVPGLYEIRNSQNYYWYYPDLVAIWETRNDEPDHDRYVVRLEVFDHNGVLQTSATVDYRDGTVAPPGPLPSMPDHIDLVLAIDNKPAELSLDVPAAGNLCGVIPFTSTPFNINTSVTQPNGRLNSWTLYYEKGLIGAKNPMTGESNVAGLSPLPRNASTSSAPFTTGLTTTCAFSLILEAWAHIRNGYGLIYWSQLIKSVAVEKCS